MREIRATVTETGSPAIGWIPRGTRTSMETLPERKKQDTTHSDIDNRSDAYGSMRHQKHFSLGQSPPVHTIFHPSVLVVLENEFSLHAVVLPGYNRRK